MQDTKIMAIKTYSLTLEAIAKIRDLADRLGMNQSEIVRLAVDKLYELCQTEQPQ